RHGLLTGLQHEQVPYAEPDASAASAGAWCRHRELVLRRAAQVVVYSDDEADGGLLVLRRPGRTDDDAGGLAGRAPGSLCLANAVGACRIEYEREAKNAERRCGAESMLPAFAHGSELALLHAGPHPLDRIAD